MAVGLSKPRSSTEIPKPMAMKLSERVDPWLEWAIEVALTKPVVPREKKYSDEVESLFSLFASFEAVM